MNDVGNSFWNYYNEELPLNVMVVGATSCDENYFVKRESSRIFAIEYIQNGTGTLEINGVHCRPSKKCTVLLPKGSSHCYYSGKSDFWVKKWIVFNSPVIESLVSFYLPQGEYCFENCDTSGYFEEINRLVERYGKNYSYLCDRIAVVLHQMIIFIKNSLNNEQSDLGEKIKSIINTRLETKLPLDDIAKELGYSKNHIIKVFKDKFHQTPYRYFSERKIDVAKLYLININMTVGEIAESLSYADSHYFANCFKACVGVTPREFRNNAK